MFVTPPLSQVHPNSPYVQHSGSNVGYSSSNVTPQPYTNNSPQHSGQYVSGPMSPSAQLDNSANQNRPYYNNGQHQMNSNYSQQQPQQQRVYSNSYGYNDYQQQQQQQPQQGWNVVTSPVNSNSGEQQQNAYNNYYPNAQPVVQQGVPQSYPQYQVNVGTPVQGYYVQQPQQVLPQAVRYPQGAVLPHGTPVQVQIQPGANWPNAYGGAVYYK